MEAERCRRGEEVGDPGASDVMVGGGGVCDFFGVGGDSNEDLISGCSGKLCILYAPVLR